MPPNKNDVTRPQDPNRPASELETGKTARPAAKTGTWSDGARDGLQSKRAQPEPAAPPKEPFKFAGFLSTIVSSVFASVTVLCIKLLPVENSIQEKAKASMLRGMSLMVLSAATILAKGVSFKIPSGEYMINMWRSSFGAANILLIFFSLQFITIGESSALVYSSPLWTCLLSRLILKEKLPVSLVLAIPMSLLGLVLLAQPDLLIDFLQEVPELIEAKTRNHSLADQNQTLSLLEETELMAELEYFEHRLTGIIFALVASVSISSVIIVMKFRRKTPIIVSTFYMGVGIVFLSICAQFLIGFGAFPTLWLEWLIHAIIGLASFGTQNSFQWSLQFVSAGTFSVVRSLDIALGFVLGALFLQEVILWTSIAGSILIMLVVVLLMFDGHLSRTVKKTWQSLKRSMDHQ